jgi:hypothetical protein
MPRRYNTLDDIQQRREELLTAIEQEGEQIGVMWNSLFKKQEESTRGEYIVSLVNHGIMAIDAFLLVRKLMKNYSQVFEFFSGKKKKKRRN